MRKLLTFILLALLGSAHAEPAAPDSRGSRINLEAHVTQETGNDVMRATLFVELEDADAGRLAEKINRATNDALKVARSYAGLRTRSSGYSTYAVTDKDKIVRWRSRAEIAVEGEDFRHMAEAIGKLQKMMQLGAVNFSIAPATRARIEEALTQSAIAEFLHRAESATKGFRGSNFSVIEATISTDGGNMPPPRPMMSMMKSASAADASPPDFEAGSSHITVTVNGAILIPH